MKIKISNLDDSDYDFEFEEAELNFEGNKFLSLNLMKFIMESFIQK